MAQEKLCRREQISEKPHSRRRTVGLFEGSEFMAQVDAEILALHEAEQETVRAGRFANWLD